MWKCQYCEKTNFDDQKICPYCNAPNLAAKNQDAAPQPRTNLYNPAESYRPKQTEKKNSILKFVLIGVAALSVLLMLVVFFQKRADGGNMTDAREQVAKKEETLKPDFATPVAEQEAAAVAVTEAPEPAQEPIVVEAVAEIYLNFGEIYQCTTDDFVLPYEIDNDDIVWSCEANEAGTECTTTGLITGGNTQVLADAGYNDAVVITGTTSNGSELSYSVITGEGNTYEFSWSSGRRNMKNYNGSVILVSPMVLDCNGFSIYYEYELTKGSIKSDNWSVWVRENGTDWVRVKDITVENKVGKVYDVVFSEPMSFSEICVQPETYSDSYEYNNSFGVGYLLFY